MASSSKAKGKNKKVPATKERVEFVVNPDEPVHDNWGKRSEERRVGKECLL